MTPLTPAWTERHTTLAFAAGLVAVAAATGSGEPWPVWLVVIGATVATFSVALAFDSFMGAVIGLVGAVIVIATKRQFGIWTSSGFAVSIVELIAIVLLGVIAGRAGMQLRRIRAGQAGDAQGPQAPEAAHALGLVPLDLGVIRLEEEIVRARLHDRPLAVLRASVSVHDGSPADPHEIDRGVSRVLESLVPVSAIVFAIDTGELIAVLPEMSRDMASRLVVALLDALSVTTFGPRAESGLELVGDHADVHLGLAFLGESGVTAGDLLDAATEAVRDPDGATTEVTGLAPGRPS